MFWKDRSNFENAVACILTLFETIGNIEHFENNVAKGCPLSQL